MAIKGSNIKTRPGLAVSDTLAGDPTTPEILVVQHLNAAGAVVNPALLAPSAAAAPGGSVPIGGIFNTTPPTGTNGQHRNIEVDANGNQRTQLVSIAVTGADAISNTALAGPVALNAHGPAIRPVVSASYLFNGTTWDRQRGSAGDGAVMKPYALNASDWSYAAPTGGITNSTAGVTIKAAAGAGVRNYITSVHIVAQALATATTLVIRDGAGGTVLLRIPLPTSGTPNGINIPLPNPLKSTANTLLEVALETLSATGGVFVNVVGYTAP